MSNNFNDFRESYRLFLKSKLPLAKDASGGKEIQTRIKRASVFKEQPFGLYSILRMDKIIYEPKKKKLPDGTWVDSDVTEPILCGYETIKKE